MRQIKFRAWHSSINEMFSAEEMGSDELTISTDGRGFVNVGPTKNMSRYIKAMIPMQFTGLLDKNGKEIYEGDIVKDDDRCTAITWGKYTGSWSVLDGDGCIFMLADCNQSLEIVGNIYQNPELLEQRN